MELCCIADLHGRCDYIPHLKEIEYDLLVICGDITSFGHYKEALDILSLIPKPYVAVHGNCDHEDVLEALDQMECNLHRRIIRIKNELFAGFGGGNLFLGKTPSEYTEEKIYEELSSIPESCILVTHAPPIDTRTDRAFKIKHAGSTAVKKITEERNPAYVLCGHIHESRNTDYIGDTLVVNPGKFSDGYYALISTEKKKCSLEKFK